VREGALSRRLSGAARAATAALFDTPTYRWTLMGTRASAVSNLPVDPWPGDPVRGAEILEGTIRFDGASRSMDGAWRAPDLPDDALLRLHGFEWLRDLRAVATPAAAARARQIVEDWLDRPVLVQPRVWRADILGTRLCAWLSHADWFAVGAERAFDVKLLEGLSIGVRHLARSAGWEVDGVARFRAIKGLIAIGTCLDGAGKRLRQGLRLLARELPRQIAADGGHWSRSPRGQVEALRVLIEIRAILIGARQAVPDALQQAIDRAAPIVRFFRHGDGGLALFNGASEGDVSALDAVLAEADAAGKAPASAPHVGFHRLAAGSTLVIVDAGPPPPPGFDGAAHAGTGSFELSVGKERIVVNCGVPPRDSPEWRLAARATAAHSTVTVEDRNLAELREDGTIGRRPDRVVAERREADGATVLDLSHDGYRAAFGLVHRRSLFLSADGGDIRGEDVLVGPAGRAFAVRFHLHPSVQATATQAGGAILLRTPGGVGWRLRASGAHPALAESVYLGGRGEPRRTQQAVLAGVTGPNGGTVKWALQREDRRG